MAAQKRKKKIVSRKFLAFLNASYPKTHLINLSTLDSSRPYGRLLENKKTRGSKELFLFGNDFQNSSTKRFPKSIQILETWKPTRHEIQTFIFYSTKIIFYLGKLFPECYQKEENLTFQNKETHNGCTKMQNYIVAGYIKGFLIIC